MNAVFAVPASAQYPADAAALELDPVAVNCPVGETVTVSGSGFLPHEPFVRIFFDGELIAEVFPDAEGTFTVTIDPPAAMAGQHTISAEQFVAPEEPDLITASAALTCQVAAGVAFTGQDLTVAVLLVAALLGIGAMSIRAGRRRAGTAI